MDGETGRIEKRKRMRMKVVVKKRIQMKQKHQK